MSFRSCFVFLLLMITAITVQAQDPHAGCIAPAPTFIPAELLERPLQLRKGVGNSHEKVTTSSAEAQAYYNQGLNYLESYVWIEAARSFHHALRLDNKLALGYLGLSYVASGLDKASEAQSFLEQAKSLSGGISDRERRRIDIREKQLIAINNLADVSSHVTYKKAVDAALVANIDDPLLWVLRGNAEEATAAGRGQRGGVASVAFYQQALRLVPDHATAHHYLVHSYETINNIEKALEHGEVYARMAPAIPHASHMWGHDLRRVGRVDDAITQFLKTDSLERAYYKEENIQADYDWHHGHNLDLLAGCYQHKGQIRQAEKFVQESASLAAMDAYTAFRKRELPSFLLHRGRYQDTLVPAETMKKSSYPQARTVGYVFAGHAYMGLSKIDAARAELAGAKKALQDIPLVTPGIIPSRAFVEPWVEALEGELLLKTGQMEQGRTLLKNVQSKLRAVPGPDAWIQTLFRLESIARIAREAGEWELAEYTATQMIDHDSAYGGSHYAMALVLQHKGNTAAASQELQTAQELWHDADKDLPELKAIQTQIALNAETLRR